jgi:hypothetical protein
MITPLPIQVESVAVSSDELDADSPEPGRSRLGVVYELLRRRVDAQPQPDTG